MSFTELLKKIKETAKLVDKYIIRNLEGDIKELYDACKHLIIAGGKRLRPFLVITSYRLFRDDIKKELQQFTQFGVFQWQF